MGRADEPEVAVGAALALRPGLLRDALAAGLERHGVAVVASCLPRPASVAPALAAGPRALLLAVLDDADLAPERAGGCLPRAAEAGVGVVAVVPSREHPLAGASLARGAWAAVGQDEPLELLVEQLRAAALATGAGAPVGRAAASPAADGPLPRRTGGVRPALSAQEERTLVLYVGGLKLAAVARRLGVRYDTAKGYLDRVRAKYAAAGRPARTKTELYLAALEDGRLDGGAAPPPP